MGSSLSNLVDNIAQGIHDVTFRVNMDMIIIIKKETCGSKYKDYKRSLEQKNVKDDLQ